MWIVKSEILQRMVQQSSQPKAAQIAQVGNLCEFALVPMAWLVSHTPLRFRPLGFRAFEVLGFRIQALGMFRVCDFFENSTKKVSQEIQLLKLFTYYSVLGFEDVDDDDSEHDFHVKIREATRHWSPSGAVELQRIWEIHHKYLWFCKGFMNPQDGTGGSKTLPPLPLTNSLLSNSLLTTCYLQY